MNTQYEVWLNARHPKTLESVATVRVFTSADRLRAEAVMESGMKDFAPMVSVLKIWQPGAFVSTEMHRPDMELDLDCFCNSTEQVSA